MNNKNEVDIANFLYLNSIKYKYQDETFIIENNNKSSYISFKKVENEFDNIYLELKDIFGNNYIEKLIYELIKRRYPLELKSDEEIYNELKDSTINNYFNEFINKYLIPLLKHYDKEQNFLKTKLNNEQKIVLQDIYKYYKSCLKKNNLITTNDFIKELEQEINKYRYIITDNTEITTKSKKLIILEEYKKEQNFKDNIKLLYDYKNYLLEKNIIPIKNAYLNIESLNILTKNFKKEYLKEIENNIDHQNKEIDIYLYEEQKRLHINKNISKICLEIIKNIKKPLILVESKKEIDNLILKNYFTKYNKTSLIDTNKNIIPYEEINNLKNINNDIIIPFLINDSYHDDLLAIDTDDLLKLKIYNLLIKQNNNKLILLCPKSKEKLIKKLLKSLKNIKFYN